MNPEKFEELVEEAKTLGSLVFLPPAFQRKIAEVAGYPEAEIIAYNAYLGDLEVVVFGAQTPDPDTPGSTNTRPCFIYVDEEVFKAMQVDGAAAAFVNGEEVPVNTRGPS